MVDLLGGIFVEKCELAGDFIASIYGQNIKSQAYGQCWIKLNYYCCCCCYYVHVVNAYIAYHVGADARQVGLDWQI